MHIIRISWDYFIRFIHLWIYWFWFLALDIISLVIDTFSPGYSVARWVYGLVPAIGFIIANIKLYAELRAENSSLLERLNTFEYRRPKLIELYGHFRILYSAFSEKKYAYIFECGNVYLDYFDRYQIIIDQETVEKISTLNSRLKEIVLIFEAEHILPTIYSMETQKEYEEMQERRKQRLIHLGELSEEAVEICQEINTLLELKSREILMT